MYQLIFVHLIILGWVHSEFSDDIIKNDKVLVYYSWDSVEYYFPNKILLEQEIKNRSYVFGDVEIFDVDIHTHNKTGTRFFVTTPRSRVGVPATVGYLSELFPKNDTPLIVPYPNLQMHDFDDDCQNIVGAYRIKIDECNRLWVMDTGTFLRAHICPPKLLAFNLLTDQLISSYTFNIETISRDPRLITPIIDIRNGKCDETFVYIPDNEQYQIFVYDHQKQKSWQVYSERFNQYEEFGVDFKATGSRDDDFQLTLGPVNDHGDRKLYFREINSGHYGYVNTSFIRNSKIFERSPNAADNKIGLLPYERARTGIETMNKDGILFYRSGYEDAIYCWTLEPHDGFDHDQNDLVLQDPKILEHASSLKIVNILEGREILMISSIPNDAKVYSRTFPNRTNYQILGGYIDDLIAGKKCGPISRQKKIFS